MAHFAEVVDGTVTRVIVADTKEWCEANLGGTWVQTSYNTIGGVHTLGGTPLHKNYAGIGYSWDGTGFASPQPFPSWVLDSQTYLWQSPVPKPEGAYWEWNEADQKWDSIAPLS